MTAPESITPAPIDPEPGTPEPGSRPGLVDARGVLCPVPIIRLARAAAALPDASEIELLTDDPAARPDVAAWCHLRGHELLTTEELADPVPVAGPPGPGAGSDEPELYAPNPESRQVLRHRIRLRRAASGPAAGGAADPAEPSLRRATW